MSDTLLQEIRKTLERIERGMRESRKKTWVKVGFIQQLTGWNKDKLKQMRESGVLKTKKDDKGMWYDLDSVPDVFIKK